MMPPAEPLLWRRALFTGVVSLVTFAGACTRLDTPPSATGGDGGATNTSYGSAGSTAASTAPDGAVASHSSSASTSAGPPMRGPEKATATTNFPFPQNRQTPSTRCTYPTNYQNS